MSGSQFSWRGPDRSEIYLERTPSDLFKAPPPQITLKESKAAGTGWHDDFATIEWEDIKEWEDFNDENVNEILKPVIHEPVAWTEADEVKLRVSRKETYHIKFENDVNRMFENSMVNLISKTMNSVCPKIRNGLGMQPVDLETKFEGAKIKLSKGKGNTSASKQPDWPIYEKDESQSKPSQIYVAGEAKRDRVFNPEWLADKILYEEEDGAYITLGQVGMYSYYGKTRYAFVVTSVSLTVMRYHFISKDAKRLRLGIEYKTIGVSVQGSQLTATKAIVALAVMSMHDKQRDIVPKDQVLPLNTWYRHEANGATVFAHLLTERLESSLPSSGYATSGKSAFNLLTHTCYQAMQTSVGNIGERATTKKGSKGLRLNTSMKGKRSETHHVLKVVLETKAKVRKSKPRKCRKSPSVTSNHGVGLSPTSHDCLDSIIKNFKASKRYRGNMVIHHRLEAKAEEAED